MANAQMTINVELEGEWPDEFNLKEEILHYAQSAIREELRQRFNSEARKAMKKWLDEEFKDGKLKEKDGVVYVPLLTRELFG